MSDLWLSIVVAGSSSIHCRLTPSLSDNCTLLIYGEIEMRWMLFLSLLFLILAIAGCSQESTNPVPAVDRPVSNAALPIQVRQIIDEKFDEILHGPTVAATPGNDDPTLARYDIYALVYLWGHLTNADGGPSVTTDWTGMLTTTAVGHLQPIMGLFFEEGQDSLVPTDANIHIAWVSFTENDFDGVAGLMFVDRDAVYTTPPTLIFNTEPFYLELPIYQLDLFYGYYLVDDFNSVAVHTRRIFTNDCPGGFMDGEWIRDDIGGLTGTFQGLWLNHDNSPKGYFSGIFWTEADGITRRFSGSLSGYDTDEVIAELFGNWAYDDPRLCPVCGSSHGWYRGRYVYLDGTITGGIRGVFGDYNQPPEENHLPLSGVWRQDCPSTFNPNSDVFPALE
jgi:hypothetical protein